MGPKYISNCCAAPVYQQDNDLMIGRCTECDEMCEFYVFNEDEEWGDEEWGDEE